MPEHFGQVRGRRHGCGQKEAEQPAPSLPKSRGTEKCLEDMVADPSDRRHGTATGYRYGCRCEKCRAAAREARRKGALRQRERREEVLADMSADPGHPSHGTYAGYNHYGCRCDSCRRAGRLRYIKTKGRRHGR